MMIDDTGNDWEDINKGLNKRIDTIYYIDKATKGFITMDIDIEEYYILYIKSDICHLSYIKMALFWIIQGL
jgi:hypothetical protein